jgi:hypothetical protein
VLTSKIKHYIICNEDINISYIRLEYKYEIGTICYRESVPRVIINAKLNSNKNIFIAVTIQQKSYKVHKD